MDALKGIALNEEPASTKMTVRNTFIDWHKENKSARRRNKSLPPSFKASRFEVSSEGSACSTCSGSDFKAFEDNVFAASASTPGSDVSTDVRTEASDDELPMSELGYASSCGNTNFASCEPCMGGYMHYGMEFAYPSEWSPAMGVDECSVFFPGVYETCFVPATSCDAPVQSSKLSSKAVAYQPLQLLTQEAVGRRKNLVDMLDGVRILLEDGLCIKSVDLMEHDSSWSLSLTPNKKNRMSTEQLLTFAQEVLLKAAEQSRNVYILGYESRETAFSPQPQGISCRLGVMENTQKACWRYFTKGTCHYGSDCCKDHAVLEAQLQIRVEMAKFAAPKQIVQQFKHEVADFLLAVTSILIGCVGVAGAETFHEDQGCCVEILVRDGVHKDQITNTVKQVITEIAQTSSVYLIGTRGEQFIAKSKGLFFTVGDMQDQTKACWDLYLHGNCRRESCCRWQHPQCLVPVNVILKAAQ